MYHEENNTSQKLMKYTVIEYKCVAIVETLKLLLLNH